jgi:hypothetical protein
MLVAGGMLKFAKKRGTKRFARLRHFFRNMCTHKKQFAALSSGQMMKGYGNHYLFK